MADTLFILDEASQLQHMKELQNAVTLLRGYEVKTWWFFQDISQAKDCFPDPSELWNNADVQVYFGTNSLESAEPLSKRLGEATIQVLSKQDGTSTSTPTSAPFEQPQGGSVSISRNVTRSEIARHLLKPEEIIGMPGNLFLAFVKGVPPICGELVRYFNAPEFRRGRGGRQKALGPMAGLRALGLMASSAVAASLFLSFALGWHERPPERIDLPSIASGIRSEILDRYGPASVSLPPPKEYALERNKPAIQRRSPARWARHP